MLVPKNSTRDGERKHTLQRSMRLGKVSVRFVMTGLLGALALLYLAQSTQSAARSYELRALDEERRELEVELEQLEIDSIRLRSLQEIEKVVPTPDPSATTTPTAVSWEPVRELAYPATAEPVAGR